MNSDGIKKELQAAFPKVESAKEFFAKQNMLLTERYGFTPDNTRFAEGGCSDEINEPEYRFLGTIWGERFKFGGLAGYCHAGRSGLNAVSHHVPGVERDKNLLLVSGPHIGYHRGEWGKIQRSGQPELTTSCGSLTAVIQAGYDSVCNRPDDPLDRQQRTVELLMLPYLKECMQSGKTPGILEATRYLLQRIEQDLLTLVNEITAHFDGTIAVITGITINTEAGNFFSPSKTEVKENHGSHREHV